MLMRARISIKTILIVVICFAFGMESFGFAEGYSVGDTVTFGSYPQGSSGEVLPIEWTVLDIDEDGYYVLISVYGLDCKKYYEEYEEVTWETCTLREWLNDEFYNNAFNAEEQGAIKVTHIVNDDNYENGTEGGNDTDDKVYLLSLDEITEYYGIEFEYFWEEHAELWCKPTTYAISNGADYFDHKRYNLRESEYGKFDGNGYWWLRSPGYYNKCAAKVIDFGFVDYNGANSDVNVDWFIVRPVIRVQLEQ